MSFRLQSNDLEELMRFDPEEGIQNLDDHLQRLSDASEARGFRFDRHAARNELQAATFRLRERARIRLLASRQGNYAIEVRRLALPEEPVDVAIAPLSVEPEDFRLAHKTTDRAFLDDPRKKSGCFEVIFTDAAGFLTQGSFTTIFLERDGVLLTPPLSRGLLPGILRAELLEQGRAVEADLRPEDLAHGFCVGNAARGLLRARLRRL